MDQDVLVSRNLQDVIRRRLTTRPVVILTGPRTVGKSTLLRTCAQLHKVPVIDLDEPGVRKSVAADPSHFAATPAEPVCFDEFQHVPEILSAIKAELNRDLRPGRFILTGSTRYSALPRMGQALTGRAHVMTIWPLSQGELLGRRENFLDAVFSDPQSLLAGPPSQTSRADYESMILTGGFPIALDLPPSERGAWFRDFVSMVIDRDVLEIRKVRQRQVLPVILHHLAARTASTVKAAAIGSAVGLDQRLVGDFIGLLEAVFLIHRLNAFGRTLTSKVARSPKVHLIDSGLAAHVLGISQRKLNRRDPAALTEFGRVVETFAVNELMKQAGWSDELVEFSHFRTRDQREVDLVIESQEGDVVGIEVKAKASIEERDFQGLRLLRDKLGPSFVAGVLLNLGQQSFRHDDRLFVMPLDRLWTP
ncbi:ATP-binding protein [Nonomuraea sp. NN258]|uniref:ATP-binding protein n=1 Tax=Nonomuraea antri TaxID=2730852 RepID=UPI001568AF26|nr:ATP-binding protein [Nonomuraea antri]NRQ34037.1 ATP-binding protein [Nonomuraea antri]